MFLLAVVLCALSLISQVKSNTLCVKEDTSCSYQLWPDQGISEDACHMTYFPRNSTQCKTLSFAAKSNTKINLGNLKLNTYLNHTYHAVLLNISFSNIKWRTASVRFLETRENDDVVCMARKFTMKNVGAPSSGVLYYDCPFIDARDEGRVFSVEFEATDGHFVQTKKLLLKVPSYLRMDDNSLKTREVFTYVDYTNPTDIHLNIQPLSSEFNVSDYKVEVWRERDKKTSLMDVRFLDIADAVNGDLFFHYNTWQEWGDYYFVVSFVNDVCPEDLCEKTVTPKIGLDRRSNRLVIGIVGASIIIPILLYTVFVWNKQCNFREALVDFSDIKILLVYTPYTDFHNNVVVSFAQALQKIFRIKVFLDVLDIPQTKHKNPLLWCSEAFQQATHIVYIAPPSAPEMYPSVYKTEVTAMRFLEEYLARGCSEKKILGVTFPYSRKNIPEVFKNFRHFHLMKDFSALVSYLVNCNRQNIFMCKSIFKRNQLMYYSEDLFYQELVDAVKRAQEDVKLTKKLSKVKKPEIKVIVPSEESLVEKEESENDTLIKKEGEYSFDVKELNLSGDKEGALTNVVVKKEGRFDIRSLDL